MNQQNGFNSQIGSNTNNNVNMAPMKPVKNRFFNQNLFDDTDFDDVGSSTSNQVNNKVITWGVGNKNISSSSTSSNNRINNLFSQELLEEVNGVVYTADEPEVLDEFDIPNNSSVDVLNTDSLFETENESVSNTQMVMENYILDSSTNNDNVISLVEQSNLNQTAYDNQIVNQPISNFVASTNNSNFDGHLLNNQSNIEQHDNYNNQSNFNNSNQGIVSTQQDNIVQQVNQFSANPVVSNNQMVNQQVSNFVETKNNGGYENNFNTNFMMNVQNNFGEQKMPMNNFYSSVTEQQSVGVENSSNLINANLLNQQPLSANMLGASSLEMANIPDDVEVENKYFSNPVPNVNNVEPIVTNVPVMGNNQVSLVDDDVVVIDEKAALKAYVGHNYEKINRSIFSFSSMLGGSFTCFCRKLYLLGVIVFILQFVSFLVFRNSLYIFLAIILFIGFVLAFIINPLYLLIAKRSIKTIRKKHSKISQGEINNLCSKKGKSNLLLSLVLQILLLCLAAFLSLKIVGKEYFIDLYNDTLNILTKKNVKVYDGEIDFDKVDVEDYFEIAIPSSFVRDDADVYKYSYVTESEGENNKCILSFGKVSGYGNAEEIIKQIEKHNNLDDAVLDNEINGLVWYSLTTKNENGTIFYKSVNLNGNIYVLEYLSGSDTSYGICDTYFVDIFDSIKEK